MQTPMSKATTMTYYRFTATRFTPQSSLVLTAILSAVFALSGPFTAQADFSGNGDIQGDVANAGHTSSPGDLIIGDTGTAGVFGDGALPLAGGDLNPLRSDASIIGNEVSSIGAVTLEDFLFLPGETDPRGGNWLIDEFLSVGNNGQGNLDLLNSARVEVEDETWIGGGDGSGPLEAATGEGYGLVTINGVGTRLRTGDGLTKGFYVGYNGAGDVQVSGRGSIESLGYAVIGEEDGSDGLVTLTDRGTRWTIDADLTIGNSRAGTTNAHGTLRIDNDARVLVKDNVFLFSNGLIDLAGGTIDLLDPSNDEIDNQGVIRGNGFVDAPMTINARGVLSNRALGEDQRQHMHVSGTVTNNSLIDSHGGEMTFDDVVTNNEEVIARDAIMTFNGDPGGTGGLVNSGTGKIILGGATTIHGTVASAGEIHVLAGSEATMVGDLVFTGGILALTAGPEAGTLDVIGEVNLGGSTELELEYSSGVFAQMGDTYEILDSTETIVGMFSNPGDMVIDDKGQEWDIVYNGTSVHVTATGNTVSPVLAGDFSGDGMVGNDDLTLLLDNWGAAVPPTPAGWVGAPPTAPNVGNDDLTALLDNWGNTAPISAITAVPEPSTLTLALLSLVCVRRRKRRS